MTAQELFRCGRLGDAVEAQIAHVKRDPSDVDARYALFVYFCFEGQLERAAAALEVVAARVEKLDSSALLLRSLLAAERERRTVWVEAGAPLFAPDPPEHLLARLRVLEAVRVGDLGAASRALDAAIEALPVRRFLIDGAAARAVRDADDRLGSVLELFVGGRYLWVPFERVTRLTVARPRSALDLLWRPATLEDVSGTSASVYLPALYEGSHTSPDEDVRLGRRTVWIDQGAEIHRGIGQRMFLAARDAGEHELPALELESLALAEHGADG